MGKLIPLGNITRLNLPVNTILKAAEDQLESVVLLGYNKEGEEYFASTIADGGEVIWLLERAKKKLLEITETIDMINE